MRFALLIPAITALGLASCQMPPPLTTMPDVVPDVVPPTTPAPLASATPETAATSSAERAPSSDDANPDSNDSDAGKPDSNNSSSGNPDTDMVGAADTLIPATPTTRPAPTSAGEEAEDTSSRTQDDSQEANAPAIETDSAPQTSDGRTAEAPTVAPPVTAAASPTTSPATTAPVTTSMAADDEGSSPSEETAPEPPVTTLAEALDEALADPVAPETGPEANPETDLEPGLMEEAAPATTELALAAPPPPPPPPPELAPQALIGLDVQGLQQRLGDADFKRREGPVETWQYRFPTCVVDYFIYADQANPAIRSWAWRSPVIGGGLDVVACRRALADRDRAEPDRANPERANPERES